MAMPKLESGESTERLTVALPQSLEDWVREKAQEGECTRGAIVRRVLRAAQRAEEKKTSRREGRNSG